MGITVRGSGGMALSEHIGTASSVLLLSSPMDHQADEACTDLLTVTDPLDEDVLSITLVHSPDDRLDRWQAHVGALPAKVGIISVGGTVRSATSVQGESSHQPVDDSLSIQTVSTPGNLTDLGIKITEYLSAWESDGNQIVACFHTLTTLAQYTDMKTIFRFVHVLVEKLQRVDAIAHFHMDPAAHDERELNMLKSVFDAVVERTDNGEWIIHSQ